MVGWDYNKNNPLIPQNLKLYRIFITLVGVFMVGLKVMIFINGGLSL